MIWYLAAVAVASAAAGYVLARWWAALLPLVVLGAFYVGLGAGWWGSGLGDHWVFAMLLVMAVGAGCAAVGIAARRGTAP